jgi:hypothetical protein
MSTALDTSPPVVTLSSGAVRVLTCDVTNALKSGETPASPTCTLTDLTTGSTYAAGLSGSASIAGNVISQKITSLVAGHRYRLVWTYVPVASSSDSLQTIIEVPF